MQIPGERIQMTDAEKNEFVQKLVGTDVRIDGLEGEVLERFRKAQGEAVEVTRRRMRLQQQVAQLQEREQNLTGQCDALFGVLVEQEEKRRFKEMKKEFDETQEKKRGELIKEEEKPEKLKAVEWKK